MDEVKDCIAMRSLLVHLRSPRSAWRLWVWGLHAPRTLAGLVLVALVLTHPETLAAVLPFLIIGLINLDPINTATTKNIMPGLADAFFKNDPLLEFFKARHHVYPGGP